MDDSTNVNYQLETLLMTIRNYKKSYGEPWLCGIINAKVPFRKPPKELREEMFRALEEYDLNK